MQIFETKYALPPYTVLTPNPGRGLKTTFHIAVEEGKVDIVRGEVYP
jgi:hypothetical protein